MEKVTRQGVHPSEEDVSSKGSLPMEKVTRQGVHPSEEDVTSKGSLPMEKVTRQVYIRLWKTSQAKVLCQWRR